MGSKSQASGMQNTASSHPGGTAPSLHPNTQLRQIWAPAAVCVGGTGKNTSLEAPFQTQWKRLWLGGISADQYIKPDNGRDHIQPPGWMEEGRRMSNTRSPGVLIQGIASSLAFQRAASPIASPSRLHRHKRSQATPLSQQPRPSEILPALLVPAWALSMAQAKRWKGRAINHRAFLLCLMTQALGRCNAPSLLRHLSQLH